MRLSPFKTVPRLGAGLFILIAGISPSQADMVTLTTVADSSIFQNNPNNSLGGSLLVSGTNANYSKSRAMIRFDLTSLPEGAIIDDAFVTMSVVRRPDPDQHGGPVDSDFGLYKLFVGWGEGVNSALTGGPAATGESTWIHRVYPEVPWGSPGGDSGIEYAPEPSTSTYVTDLGDYTFPSSGKLIEDVQSWKDDPQNNFGFMLISSNEFSAGTGRRWASLESQLTGHPATLTVSYTVVPEPGSAILLLTGALALGAIRRRHR